MKRNLSALIREVDSFCARLNAGLTAVAILLGFMVMTMSMIKAQEFIPQGVELFPTDYEIPLGN
jgi:hypothetical protein